VNDIHGYLAKKKLNGVKSAGDHRLRKNNAYLNYRAEK
jgi:hypothetical protein